MTSPAYGLAWLFWQRHRLGMCLLAGYGVALAAYIQTLPAGRARDLAILLSLPLMFGIPYLLAVFTHPEADVASGASGYPGHLLVLPVRTRSLALWPALYGALTLAGTWLFLAGLVFRPANPSTPLFWPAALLAAVVVTLQALFWTPFPVPYLRMGLALVLLPALIIGGIYGHLSGVSQSAIVIFFLSVTAAAGWLAQAGLARARHGDGGEQSWQTARDRQQVGQGVGLKPFGSAFRAQVWIEWTRNGMILPSVTAAILLLTTLPMLLLSGQEAPPFMIFGAISDLQPGFYLRAILIALLAPVWLAAVLGCGARKSHTRAKDLTLHPFLATRPLGSARIVVAKMAAAGLSCLATWAVVLLVLLLWSLVPGRLGEETGTLGGLLLAHSTPRDFAAVTAALFFLMLWTWRNQVVGLFVDLTGRKWIVNGAPAAGGALFTVALYLGALYLPDPENMRRLAHAMQGILYTLAGVKFAVGIVAAGALFRARLLPVRTFAALAGGWLALLSLLVISGRMLLPAGWLTAWQITLAAFLWLPAARLALAPLSLYWNRHR